MLLARSRARSIEGSTKLENVVIASAVRTAFGTFGGSLKTVPPVELTTIVVKEALSRANLSPEAVDSCVFGNVLPRTDENNLAARCGGLAAGLPETVPCHTVIRGCGSGIESVIGGTRQVMLGEDEIVITGGVDNMSMAPYLAKTARFGLRMRDAVLTDSLWEVLKDPITGLMMGETAENIARRHGITRHEQDEHALASNQKALKAIADGKLKGQIVPVEIKSRKGTVVFDTDEHPKDTTLEALGKLPPAFVKDGGTVTAGNASGINDGAAAVVLMSETRASAEGIQPLGKVVAYGIAGVDPAYMGYGPVPSSRIALERAGMSVSDIDLWEINEAFSAQYLYCERELGVDPSVANIWGGAVAYGHPVGASGGRLIATILEELKDQDKTLGLATLCIGGGQGIAMIVERL